jgi:hypothetical protein
MKRFVPWGDNEDRARTRLYRSVGVCNGGTNAANVKVVQSAFALHQLRPEGRGAKKDLLLQLRKLGRRHNRTSVRHVPTLEVAVEAQSKRSIRAKRNLAIVGDEKIETGALPANYRIFVTASVRGRGN